MVVVNGVEYDLQLSIPVHYWDLGSFMDYSICRNS